jgi:anion-transporting  ArsA/GET3 family ATPase
VTLLTKRLLFVMGKGGVGKSTVAAALGSLAADDGLRTIVAEVAGRNDVPRVLGVPVGDRMPEETEAQLKPGLFWISIDPQHALQEYLLDQLRVRALAEVLGASRAFNYLAAAAPGLQELLTVGKLWELAQDRRRTLGGEPYDLVIVDAPATGHGIAYLLAPRTFAGVARTGPVARQARTIDAMLVDTRRTGVIAVATPHELPVAEVLFMHRELVRQMGPGVDRVVVNAVHPARFSAREVERLRDALGAGQSGLAPDPEPRNPWEPPQPWGPPPRWGPWEAGVRAAISQHEQARDQRRQIERLRRGTGRAPASLSFLYSSSVGPEELRSLSDQLRSAL